MEVLLQLLINAFRLSIPLWVVSSGGSQLDPEPLVEFSGELCHELGSTVGHYLAGQAVVLPDMLNEQTGHPSCSDGCEGGYEVGSFSDGVHYYHHRIVTL